MTIESMDYAPAFHYELQTFLEKRETSWTYAPHHKGRIENNCSEQQWTLTKLIVITDGLVGQSDKIWRIEKVICRIILKQSNKKSYKVSKNQTIPYK